MARKFYNKLYKEFALADLTRYKEGKLGLRWRSEAEVDSGKGQHSCGSLHCQTVDSTSDLHSYEVCLSGLIPVHIVYSSIQCCA